ncbi:MAG TPA: helix-hairpin-helix domain-containing protein [bacterium]
MGPPWPRAAQRVLLVAAAALLAATLLAARRAGQTPLEVPVADDPRLEVRIDLNAATAAELEALPGVGASLASRIVAHRGAHGPFRSVEDLDAVSGVGKRLVERLRPLVACGDAPPPQSDLSRP